MKLERLGEVIVPELEDEMTKRPLPKYWSKEEEAVLRTYYGRISARKIAQYLKKAYPPGRSLNAIFNKARMMGLVRIDREL